MFAKFVSNLGLLDILFDNQPTTIKNIINRIFETEYT